MIRTVLFDMGNVLVHFCHDRMCRQIGELCGCSTEDIRRMLFDSELQWEFERGLLTEQEFHRAFVARTGVHVELEPLKRAASDIFELNEPIVPVLDCLREEGVRLVLLSNTSSAHFEFIEREFDVLQRFDAFATSFEAGAIKPEPAIYERALQLAECAPQECFYTDDIPRYIEKGREFGIHAEVFTAVPPLIEQLRSLGVALRGL